MPEFLQNLLNLSTLYLWWGLFFVIFACWASLTCSLWFWLKAWGCFDVGLSLPLLSSQNPQFGATLRLIDHPILKRVIICLLVIFRQSVWGDFGPWCDLWLFHRSPIIIYSFKIKSINGIGDKAISVKLSTARLQVRTVLRDWATKCLSWLAYTPSTTRWLSDNERLKECIVSVEGSFSIISSSCRFWRGLFVKIVMFFKCGF